MRVLICDPQVEVRGEVLLANLQGLRADDIAPYVKKHDLSDVQPGQWYPIQPFINLLNDLAANVNSMPNFVSIGMYVAENAHMPPELSQPSFEELLIHWDDHYQANHRNGDIGHKIPQKIDDKHYQLTLDGGLYPDDLEYGVLYGFARRFLPPRANFTVWYDDNIQCLDQGGEKTVLHVSWE